MDVKEIRHDTPREAIHTRTNDLEPSSKVLKFNI